MHSPKELSDRGETIMCETISGKAVLLDDNTIKVYTLRDSDSHTDIEKAFGIKDTEISLYRHKQTSVELIPVTSLTDISGMKFKFDDKRPDWWTEEMTEFAKQELFNAFRSRWDGNVYNFKGDAYFSSLKSIAENTTITSGGHAGFRSLKSIAENSTITIGGHAFFRRLESISKNSTINIGGDAGFRSLKSIAENSTITIGGDAGFYSLKSLPDNVKVKGKVYLKEE